MSISLIFDLKFDIFIENFRSKFNRKHFAGTTGFYIENFWKLVLTSYHSKSSIEVYTWKIQTEIPRIDFPVDKECEKNTRVSLLDASNGLNIAKWNWINIIQFTEQR